MFQVYLHLQEYINNKLNTNIYKMTIKCDY